MIIRIGSEFMKKDVSDFNVIYVVIQQAEHYQFYRGKFDKNAMLIGFPCFIYEDGVYKKTFCKNSKAYMYLSKLASELEGNGYIDIETIEPIYDDFYKYEFVGGFRTCSLLVDELVPFEYDDNIKTTLSSALLGYIHSNCINNKGIIIDGMMKNSFDIKDMKIKRRTR